MKERRYRADGLLLHSRENRHGMTKEENHLWFDYLRYRSFVVKRQFVIDKYIADFYIPCAKLVIELDGGQHRTEAGAKYDAVRDDFIEKHGIKVIRFSNRRINEDFRSVCQEIYAEVISRSAHPSHLRAEGASIEDLRSKSSY